MNIIAALLGGVLAVLSAGILLYVSLATGLGPWLAPTLALIAGGVLCLFSHNSKRQAVIYAQAVGSTGGSIAVAIGFALPTFYFLQPTTFNKLLASPFSFALTLGSVVLAAGLWGIAIAHQQAPQLLADSSLRFPVSAAITAALNSTASRISSWLLFGGISSSMMVCWLRDGMRRIATIAPTWYLGNSLFGTILPLQLLPVAWAIGFLAGLPIALPLLIGMISKYAVVMPLNTLTALSYTDFTFAFCSGIVLGQTVQSLLPMPRLFLQRAREWWLNTSLGFSGQLSEQRSATSERRSSVIDKSLLLPALLTVIVLTALSFPVAAQLLLLILSYLFTQHLSHFACRTGLGTYGRYMTFAMVPIMLCTAVNEWHITLICVFVGVAGATAVDMLFSYKVAVDNGLAYERIREAQIIGLIVTALTIGILFWLLCSQFQLGGSELVAHRAQGRALLLHSFSFDVPVLLYGALFGCLLKLVRINPILAFGGLIMPNAITLGLVLGAGLRALTRTPDYYAPFWSGVFAGDALWVLARLFF